MIKQIFFFGSIMILFLSSRGFAGRRIVDREEYGISPEIESICLQGHNGSITWLPPGSDNKSKVVVEKLVREGIVNRNPLDQVSVENHSNGGKLNLKVTRPREFWGSNTAEVRFTVYASPEQIRVFQAQTNNGAIEITAAYKGVLDLKTSNGSIKLASGTGELALATSNGAINLGISKLTGSSCVQTSNGRVAGTVFFASDGNYVFGTSNGSIDLQMPKDTQGTFSLSTSTSSISFNLGDDKMEGRRRVNVTRGQGPAIGISTSNGKIKISEID